MKKIILEGTVFSSRGEGKKFVGLPWVKKQIEEKLGFTPYAGTLNLRLPKEGEAQGKQLSNASPMEIYPEKGYCKGILIKAQLGSLECAIIIPKVPNYPNDVLEIIAPVNLREHLNLKDDDKINLSVNV